MDGLRILGLRICRRQNIKVLSILKDNQSTCKTCCDLIEKFESKIKYQDVTKHFTSASFFYLIKECYVKIT